jgi:hypothetical protein
VKRLLVFSFCFALAGSLLVRAQSTASGSLIVNAAAVRLRATPSTGAAIVKQMTIGAEVALLEREPRGEWIRVRTTTGEEGWISGRLATAIGADGRLAAIERLIRERLARDGDGFPAASELLNFVTRMAGEQTDAEIRARFTWHELRATSLAARAIPFITDRVTTTEPYASWLKAREALVFYNEPGGIWMIKQPVFLDAYDRHRGTAAADDILWESVLNGLGGECETDIACHLGAISALEGEYLRRERYGRHDTAARERAIERLNMLAKWLDQPDIFTPARDCAAATKATAPLFDVLINNEAPMRTFAYPALRRIQDLCALAR